jgi:predicted lipid-binding transport protein (Tim44 family)
MKRTTILTLAAFAVLTLTLNGIADARRMGGGGNFGAQRSVPAQKAAPAPAAPASNAASPSSPPPSQPAAPASASAPKAPSAAAPTPPPSGASRWLGPIAGIAAGLGLAALMSHLGLSEGFGTILLLGLVIFAGIFVLRMFLRRQQTSGAPLQYSAATASANSSAPSPFTPPAPSAPSWRIPSTSELAGQSASALAAEALTVGVTRKTLPQGFDAAAFATEAKRQYIQIQRSYDDADRAALSSVMTADMATEMARELDQRGLHHPTEIVTLDADVLDVSTEDDKYWISVRFTGQVKEDGEPLPHSIDEVWNLTKPVKGGSGWLLAGISQVA